MSIRTKIVLILFAFVIIPGVLFSVMIYGTARSALMDVRIAQLNNIAALKKERIEVFFNAWRSQISMAQHNPDIEHYLSLLITNAEKKESAAYRQAYSELQEQLQAVRVVNGYLSIMLTDTKGNIVYTIGDGRRDPQSRVALPVHYFHEARKNIFFSDIYRRSSENAPLAMVGAGPVHNTLGDFVGEIVIEQEMDPIYRSILDMTGLGRTGEILIVRREGDAVRFLSPLKGDPQAAFTKKVPYNSSQAYPAQRASRGETGSGFAFDYIGTEVLAAWQYLPSLRWGLVTKIEVSEAFAPVARLLNLIIILGSVILSLAVIAAYAVGRSVTDPILDLQKGTTVIGSGDLDHKVGTTSKDEVGNLSRLIDSMTDNLKRVTASRNDMNVEITVRKRAEEMLSRLNRLYVVLVKVNEAIARTRDPEDLYESVCRIVVEQGSFLMAWIGLVDPANRSIRPTASFGDVGGYLDSLSISAEDVPEGRGPTGTAVRESRHVICSEIETDPIMQPWREKALAQGYRSSASFPITLGADVVGAFTMYSGTPRFFTDEEVKLLNALADDLSFAMGYFAAERQRQVTHSSLLRSLQEIEDLYNNAPCGYHSIDKDGAIVRINDTELGWLGRERKDVLGKIRFVDLMTDESRKTYEGVFPQFMKNGTASNLEYDIKRQDGSILSVLLSATAMRDRDGSFLMSRSTLYDVTERKEINRRITVTNALIKQFARTYDRKSYLNEAVAIVNQWSQCRHTGIRIVDSEQNIPFEACIGYDREFLETENRLSLKEHSCACTRVVSGSQDMQDLPGVTPNGSFFTNDLRGYLDDLRPDQRTRFRSTCVRNGFASIAVIPVKYRDTLLGAIHLSDERAGMVPAAHVEFLEQLAFIIGEAVYRFGIEEERARLVSAVESAAEAIVITDPATGVIVYANPAFEQMTGYSADEIIGRTLHFLESGKLGEEYYAGLRESLASGGVWNGRLINRRKNGALYYEDCTVSPVKDGKGAIVNYVYVKRDVTEKLRFEAIAESVNTMDNIGYVFSGVRHEIGNPINSINMILGILRAKQDTLASEAIRDYLARMTEQVSRVEYILRSLKSFNLYETQEPQNIDLSQFIENFLPLIKEDLGKKGIVIETDAEPGATAYADPRALQQVLLNIITNAADAVSGREKPLIALSLSRNADTMRIRVRDNGQGVPEDKVKEIFRPFYTTKAHGTGLGLVIVQKMLARMNGSIGLESVVGEGTTVDITIPEGRHEVGKSEKDAARHRR